MYDVCKRLVKQLPTVFWAYITTPKHSIGLSPFHLTHGFRVVLPTEYLVLNFMIKYVEDRISDQLESHDKALLDETGLHVMEHIRKYQLDLKKRYEKQVKQRTFRPGGWV